MTKTVVYDGAGVETVDSVTEILQCASSEKLQALSASSLTVKSKLRDVIMCMFK